jgi:hypothetical protein
VFVPVLSLSRTNGEPNHKTFPQVTPAVPDSAVQSTSIRVTEASKPAHPPIPSRAIPQGFTAEGDRVDLPPLPASSLQAHQPTAEPSATPQSHAFPPIIVPMPRSGNSAHATLAGYRVADPAPAPSPRPVGHIELQGNVRIHQPDGTQIEADSAQIVLTGSPSNAVESVRAASFRVILDRGVPTLVPSSEPVPIGPACVPSRDDSIRTTSATASDQPPPAPIAIPVKGGVLEFRIQVRK